MKKNPIIFIAMLIVLAFTSCQMNTDDSVVTPPAPTTEATYTITVTYDNTNGSAKVTNASGKEITSAKAGENVTLTVTPKSGYKFDATITINGQPETQTDSAERSYTMAMPSSNITVNVSFTQISNNNGGNGTGEAKDEAISDGNLDIAKAIMFSSNLGTDWGDVIVTNAKGQKIKSANAGAVITLTVKPKSGYELGCFIDNNNLPVKDSKGNTVYLSVTNCELTKVDNTTYTFVMPETFVTIQARFDPVDGYTVTSDYFPMAVGKLGTGSTVTFSEKIIKVKPGEWFTIKLENKANVSSLVIDGNDLSNNLTNAAVVKPYPMPAHDVAVTTTLKNQQ